jgi:hypothetical protein
MSSKYPWLIFIAAGICAAAGAQEPPLPPLEPLPPVPPDPDKLFVLQNIPPLSVVGGKIDIIRSEGGVLGPVVKGKPYSGRAITESTQMLADGNRITHRNEAVLYRDSEGRSRREQTLTSVGPWQAGEPMTTINIHDPVARKSYVLDPVERTAREIRQFQMAIAHDQAELAKAAGDVRAIYNYSPGGAAPIVTTLPGTTNVTVIKQGGGETMIHRAEGGANVQIIGAQRGVVVFPEGTTGAYEPPEDLGEQVLEGLLVKGTRMTDTIPAGAIGNERPIEIVTERWFSEEIDAMVLQRFSDPRFGETTYRLVNVVRGDPSPDLFEVPQGYEIETAEMPRPVTRAIPAAPAEKLEFELRRVEQAR